jgi:hypothetical protein
MRNENLTETFPSLKQKSYLFTYCNLTTCKMSQNLLLILDTFLVYQTVAQELITNENILMQTVGFDVSVEHPHQHIVRWFSLFRGKCLAVITERLGKCRLHMCI